MEIRDRKVADGSMVYSWNGQKYGLWPTTPHAPVHQFAPAMNAQGNISCRVTPSGSKYLYDYQVASDSSSASKVQDFYVAHGSMDTLTSAPEGWRFIGAGPEYPLYAFWALGKSTDMISPGGTKAGFTVTSPGLPKLARFCLKSERPRPNPDSVLNYSQAFWQDVYGNSYVGQTIAPYPAPTIDPYASMLFTDTLLSYTARSRSLNWIMDQTTADKYTGLFNRVHSDLDQQQKSMALLRLDTVLAQVRADSSEHLTSEAYALLRFNTEYLQTLIPEDPLPIQLWYFTATVIADRHVELEWGTLSERDNYGFYAQKSQSETTGFTNIPNSFVAGHGTTTQPH